MKNGNIWSWGCNGSGQLGNGTTKIEYKPTKITTGTVYTDIIASTAYGYSARSVLAIDSEGQLWGWGENNYGELGNRNLGTVESTTQRIQTTPIKIVNGIKFVTAEIGYMGVYGIDTSGRLWTWGKTISADEYTEPHAVNIENILGKDERFTKDSAKGVLISTSGAVYQIILESAKNPYIYKVKFINKYTVTFKNGEITEKTEEVIEGNSATAPSWTRAGYTLTWDTDFTNVTSDLTVNAIWTARNDTPYKIVHHFRNLDTEVEGYNEEEEAKTGTTDTQVTAEYKTLEGFTKNENHPNKVETGTLAGDGNLILHLYYNRNTYNITYELNGGTQSSPLTNKYVYGKEMILQTNRVTKEGYTFAGWYDNSDLAGSPVTTIPSTATGDKTFYAKWVDVEQEYYILSEKYSIDLVENIITKVSPETNVTEFLSKIETNGQKKVVNAQGQEITDISLVGTGYKLQVTFKGEIHTYEIAVRGDLDGNGKITTTDLSIINQQILHKIELTGIRAKAADTDYNGRLTTTDLSMINQAVLRKITL